MSTRIPIVDYLALEPTPRLVAHECTACGARFFDHRVACASCSGRDFAPAEVATEGVVTAYTVVMSAPPGVPTPFVAAIVECDGTPVRANLVGVDPDPAQVRLGMKVRLVTTSVDTDSTGTEAVGFGFAPID